MKMQETQNKHFYLMHIRKPHHEAYSFFIKLNYVCTWVTYSTLTWDIVLGKN